LSGRTVLNAIPKVRWWYDFLTTEPIGFSTFKGFDGTVAELLDTMFDPTVDFDDLVWIKDQWPGKVFVKGVQTLDDAKRVADCAVDGVLLSNHGGRQLDRAPSPVHLLPTVVREVGNEVEVWIDTGIMSGADIVASIALGAGFTLVGRAYLYGLRAGGRRGADRAIEILSEEIVRTMKLLGERSLAELEPSHVTQLRRLLPVEPRNAANR
jgi:L-lactate dehydrogenase (cytochrome)